MSEIWTFKYEPKTLKEMVVDLSTRVKLSKVLNEKPNIMLSGPPGIGKGTFTNIYLKTTGIDRIKINASDETGIDNIREKVKSFATAGSSDLKVVIMNEADFLSIPAQSMLRDLIEQVYKITRFIFQCNYPYKIIPEIHSRCQMIDLSAPPAKAIYLHIMDILKNEKIKVQDKQQIVELIKKLYPDIRSIINTVQFNCVNGKIGKIKIFLYEDLFNNILDMILKGNINELRKTIKSNQFDYVKLYEHLYENLGEFSSPGDALILISEYLYRNSFSSIKEINFMGMITKMMKEGIV